MKTNTPSVETATDSTYATIELSMNPGAQSFSPWTPNEPTRSATKSVTSVPTRSASASDFPCKKGRFGRP